MYIIRPIAPFTKNLKKLKKKYSRIKTDLSPLIKNLEQGIFEGDKLQGFDGDNVYKVRVASSDQKKGKRGGFRVIYYVVTDDSHILLLFIYAKVLQSNPSTEQIKEFKQAIEDLKNQY